jgi:DNA-binding transcriptional regulator YhcF (GntR family)
MPLRKLATKLEMDRTTLTRSLSWLERDGLISVNRPVLVGVAVLD